MQNSSISSVGRWSISEWSIVDYCSVTGLTIGPSLRRPVPPARHSSARLSICPSVRPSLRPSVVRPPARLSVCPSIRPSVPPSSTRLPVCPSVRLPTRRPPAHLSVCPSVVPSVHRLRSSQPRSSRDLARRTWHEASTSAR